MSQSTHALALGSTRAAKTAWCDGLPFVVRTLFGIGIAVVITNLLGSVVITFLVLALNDGAPHGDRMALLAVSSAYAVVAMTVGTIFGASLHKRTLRWLSHGDVPTYQEARRTLRTPIDVAVITAVLWLVGAVVIGGVVAAQGIGGAEIVGIGGGVALAGLSTAGVTYLLVARTTRPITQLALATYPPRNSPLLSVRVRLMVTWWLTTAIPLVGIILVLTAPPGHSHVRGAAIVLAAVALAVGLLSTGLAARAIGTPMRDLLNVLRQVGSGSLDTEVVVDDPGEIGMLQGGVNDMVAGLREREQIRDMFGRHVGPAVAQEAMRDGVTLSGEARDVVALFVDITGSTALTRTTDPGEFVAMLNRFFSVVIDTVERARGLVNKFEGDAALCIFGAPVELDDPATAALSAAREIRDRIAAAGEVQIGIGVAAGPVIAGQIGAASRLEYTVIGDAVNEAARLTDLAKAQPGCVLASDVVVLQASPLERAHWHAAGEVVVRGRSDPTRTWAADCSD
ncbi:MAG: adenylate/guanylate cyclase domain-containing protein [Pseudonocardiales bacterium]|nr:MAG: adenylate/guanylate cyclase domain-containing protein [Pseudonocardiales bacterium]